MATVILMLRRARHRDATKSVDGDAVAKERVDSDGDGIISWQELQSHIDDVDIVPKALVTRMKIERNIASALIKTPNFIMCMICFVIAINTFAPAEGLHNTHRNLRNLFKTAAARQVNTYEQLYNYMILFSEQNEKLQASSWRYWCEARYFSFAWDDTLGAPVKSCVSPQYYALGLLHDVSQSWSYLNHGHAHPPETAAAHRRLSEEPEDHGGSSNESSPPPGRPCADDDRMLQEEEGDPDMTCVSAASHVCENSMGIRYCMKTCGFCRPFTYEKLHMFKWQQLTLLPAMVFQTRWMPRQCEGFSATYNAQGFNGALWSMPALDGKRTHGDLIQCIDRTRPYEGQYAIEIECPPNAPLTECPDGKKHATEGKLYHGQRIFPEMLNHVDEVTQYMKNIHWLDAQTNEVTLSTMVYTEAYNLYTVISIHFKVDETGNVDGTYKIVSYRDLINDDKATFITCMVLSISGAFVGLLLSAWTLWDHSKSPDCEMDFQFFVLVYEMMSRAILMSYCIVLLISWTQQPVMSHEYQELMDTYLNLRSPSKAEQDHAIEEYFHSKTVIYEATNWLMRHKLCIFLIIYVQFLQLVFYFCAHPKMAVLTDTIIKAASNILHFLLYFFLIFFVLAFKAHWLLGESIPGFGTFGDAAQSQGRMIFGEFIFASGAEDLTGPMIAMYWIYAFTFMIVVFFTLLNFFLAIIVDAFADVKERNEELIGVNSVWYDIADTIVTGVAWKMGGWPGKDRVIEFLLHKMQEAEAAPKACWEHDGEEDEDEDVKVCPSALMMAFPDELDKTRLSKMLAHYLFRVPGVVKAKKASEPMKHEKEGFEHPMKVETISPVVAHDHKLNVPQLRDAGDAGKDTRTTRQRISDTPGVNC